MQRGVRQHDQRMRHVLCNDIPMALSHAFVINVRVGEAQRRVVREPIGKVVSRKTEAQRNFMPSKRFCKRDSNTMATQLRDKNDLSGFRV